MKKMLSYILLCFYLLTSSFTSISAAFFKTVVQRSKNGQLLFWFDDIHTIGTIQENITQTKKVHDLIENTIIKNNLYAHIFIEAPRFPSYIFKNIIQDTIQKNYPEWFHNQTPNLQEIIKTTQKEFSYSSLLFDALPCSLGCIPKSETLLIIENIESERKYLYNVIFLLASTKNNTLHTFLDPMDDEIYSLKELYEILQISWKKILHLTTYYTNTELLFSHFSKNFIKIKAIFSNFSEETLTTKFSAKSIHTAFPKKTIETLYNTLKENHANHLLISRFLFDIALIDRILTNTSQKIVFVFAGGGHGETIRPLLYTLDYKTISESGCRSETIFDATEKYDQKEISMDPLYTNLIDESIDNITQIITEHKKF